MENPAVDQLATATPTGVSKATNPTSEVASVAQAALPGTSSNVLTVSQHQLRMLKDTQAGLEVLLKSNDVQPDAIYALMYDVDSINETTGWHTAALSKTYNKLDRRATNVIRELEQGKASSPEQDDDPGEVRKSSNPPSRSSRDIGSKSKVKPSKAPKNTSTPRANLTPSNASSSATAPSLKIVVPSPADNTPKYNPMEYKRVQEKPFQAFLRLLGVPVSRNGEQIEDTGNALISAASVMGVGFAVSKIASASVTLYLHNMASKFWYHQSIATSVTEFARTAYNESIVCVTSRKVAGALGVLLTREQPIRLWSWQRHLLERSLETGRLGTIQQFMLRLTGINNPLASRHALQSVIKWSLIATACALVAWITYPRIREPPAAEPNSLEEDLVHHLTVKFQGLSRTRNTPADMSRACTQYLEKQGYKLPSKIVTQVTRSAVYHAVKQHPMEKLIAARLPPQNPSAWLTLVNMWNLVVRKVPGLSVLRLTWGQ